MAIYRKRSDANKDYGFDWSDWLASGETISSSSWSIPGGLTEGTSDNSTTQTSVWISGGIVGQNYTIINTITTSEGRTDSRTHEIFILSPYVLVTLNELKNFPGLSQVPQSQDVILEELIEAATSDFEKEWNNYGIQRTICLERHAMSEIRRMSRNANKIQLKRYPILTASGVVITDPAGNSVASTDFWIDPDVGQLVTIGGWPTPYDSNGFET